MRASVVAFRGVLRSATPHRTFSNTARRLTEPASVNPRWLSELQARVKRCSSLNLSPAQTEQLQILQKTMDEEWLELLAGREGYLTGPGWRGLDKHTVTWGDQVSRCNGHVNNVVYNKYAESARFNWLRNFSKIDPSNAQEWADLMSPKSIGLIMRSIKTDYKFPMAYPDNLTVFHKLTTCPTPTSDAVFLEALLVSHRHRRPAARCFEDIVVYDYRTAKRTPLKPFMVEHLRATFAAQEESRRAAEAKAQDLLSAVQSLESA
ncbi:hypothetical protein CTRI78_v006230 [Colletotrichum trifolii]|uniref:Uncharacterized protein n=1 Tax=Colletotrichum trifolii TaxID=5466 RepID=A0A4R8RG25_COLTR|nr:hypothetical protein CTRI78_v006230 [Colletotrichum trifolii]